MVAPKRPGALARESLAIEPRIARLEAFHESLSEDVHALASVVRQQGEQQSAAIRDVATKLSSEIHGISDRLTKATEPRYPLLVSIAAVLVTVILVLGGAWRSHENLPAHADGAAKLAGLQLQIDLLRERTRDRYSRADADRELGALERHTQEETDRLWAELNRFRGP